MTMILNSDEECIPKCIRMNIGEAIMGVKFANVNIQKLRNIVPFIYSTLHFQELNAFFVIRLRFLVWFKDFEWSIGTIV